MSDEKDEFDEETVKKLLQKWGSAHWDLNLNKFAQLLGLDISTSVGERYALELFNGFNAGLQGLARLDTANLTKLANYRKA